MLIMGMATALIYLLLLQAGWLQPYNDTIVLQYQLLADLGLALAMVFVAVILFQKNLLGAVADYFGSEESIKTTWRSSDIPSGPD